MEVKPENISVQDLQPVFFEITELWSIDEEISKHVRYANQGNQDMTGALCTRRMRWYEQVTCATSSINSVSSLNLPGQRGRGDSKKPGQNVSGVT